VAATYTVVTQYPGIDSLGGTQTQDVIFVGITTIPHGIYLEFPIPTTVYSATQVADYGIGFSGTVEAVYDNEWVVGAQWSQIVNPSNMLESVLIITVTSTSGNSTGTVTIPQSQWAATFWNPPINNLHAQLDDAENL
jgi:hypothetical protein